MNFDLPIESISSRQSQSARHKANPSDSRTSSARRSPTTKHLSSPQAHGVDTLEDIAPSVTSSLEDMHASDAPSLPDPIGPSADPATVRRSISQPWIIEGFSAYGALQTMTDNAATNMKLSQLIKRTRTSMQFQARTRELMAKGLEITGQNRSATWQFVGSMAGASMSLLAAWSVGFQDVIIGQTISGITNIADQRLGGRAQANAAALEQKQEVNTAQLEQTRIDASSAWYEQVKEARKNAQQAIMTHIQMVGEAINTVWR